MDYTIGMRGFMTICLLMGLCAPAFAFPSGQGLAAKQAELAALPLGDRIAAWAEAFLGTPYDTDPLGAYVTRRAIAADDAVDCMYHAFRSVELAMSRTPEEAVETALLLRFRSRGVLQGGEVLNYDDRFQYAMDMLSSGRWGRDITGDLAATEEAGGARGYDMVRYIPARLVPEASRGMLSGDIVYFVKDPSKRVVGEIIGHLGIVKVERGDVWLIHASGSKGRGGSVVKVSLRDYARRMPFIGIKVSRFYLPVSFILNAPNQATR